MADRIKDAIAIALDHGWTRQEIIDRMSMKGYPPEESARLINEVQEGHRSYARTAGRILQPIMDRYLWETYGQEIVIGGAVSIMLLTLFHVLIAGLSVLFFIQMVIGVAIFAAGLKQDYPYFVYMLLGFVILFQLFLQVFGILITPIL